MIWATGYRPAFDWIKLPVFDAAGFPIQRAGASVHPGLYFLGLHLMHRRGSGFILGVGADAADITDDIAGRVPAAEGRRPSGG